MNADEKTAIRLTRDITVRGQIWRAGSYLVPDEMPADLMNWLFERRPDVIEEARVIPSPPQDKKLELEKIDASLIDLLPGEARPTPQKTAYERFQDLIGGDLIEIFGDAGSCKSRLLGHIAIETQESGKKVLFLDNENSLPKSVAAKLKNYRYVGINLDKIIDMVANCKEHYDLICLDSIGFPVLIEYVRLSLREQLRAIQKMILLRGHLKNYAIEHKGLAIVTNQPVSEYSIAELPRDEREVAILEPFGGKGMFISKLLLRTDLIQHGETTKVAVRTYKARDLPFDKKIAEFTVNSERTDLKWV